MNLATGVITHQVTPRHRAVEFQKLLNLIDRTVPDGLAVHVVLDNSSAKKRPVDPTMAGILSSLRIPLYAHQLVVDDPRRSAVRRDLQQMDPTRQPP